MLKAINKTILFLIFLLWDSIIISITFFAAFPIREFLALFVKVPELSPANPVEFFYTNWWVVPIYLVSYLASGLYHKRRPFWDEVKESGRATIFGALIVYTIISLGKLTSSVSRLIFVLHPLVLIIIFPLAKRILKLTLAKIGLWRAPALQITLNSQKDFSGFYTNNPYLGYRVVEKINADTSHISLVTLEKEIAEFTQQNPEVRTLILVTSNITEPSLSELVERMYFLFPQVLIIPDSIGLDVFNADISHIMYGNIFIFDIRKGLSSQTNAIFKRLTDLFISVVGLIFVIPVILAYNILVTILDGSPDFYKCPRFAKGGKPLKIYKLRSMYKNTETKYFKRHSDGDLRLTEQFFIENPDLRKDWDEYQKIPENKDPRIIPVIGHFVRKTDLDEIPQLINVLKGEMSIVGPRPYMPREKKLMGKYFERILSVKPGLIGLWQITGRNDYTFEERLQVDTWYIQNWSMWLDIVIIFKLFAKVFNRRK